MEIGKVEVDADAFNAAVEHSLAKEMEQKTGYRVGQELHFEKAFEFIVDPQSDFDIQEVWGHRCMPFKVDLGDTEIDLCNQLDDRIILGFVNPDSGEWLYRVEGEKLLKVEENEVVA